MSKLLDGINSPADLKKLTVDQLETLCAEIRAYMLDCCSRNPGHVASSLGAVDLIVALHYIYDAPKDKIIFDVGHQAYAHKIITGRRDAFDTLRKEGGLTGFPKMDESGFDAFGVGHSSTSISAALGYAEAAKIKGDGGRTVAFIGDGALTGGLAFEGLNNAGASETDILIILNDNNQSIDPNKGAIHNSLLRITTSSRYNRMRTGVWNLLGEGKFRLCLQRMVKSVKSWFVQDSGGALFESLGFRYFGPIDGNDIDQVVDTLRRLSTMKGPRILHCITTKGKGYAPAEQNPVVWHAPGRFNPQTGEIVREKRAADRYQDVFGQTLCDLASMDGRVVGITPAMATGCGMNVFAQQFKERFFDVGIEEEHAVTFSAGLAAGGLRPFCNIYSSFSQRAYDQIIHDVALQNLPVVLCFDRAGLVGEDGATHTGAYDIAAYRSIPGTIIAAPRNELELRNMMYTALHSQTGPFIIRYPRGMAEGVEWKSAQFSELPVGRAVKCMDGDTVAVIATGPVVNRALEAAAEYPGRVAVYDFRYVKPLDEQMLEQIASSCKAVLTCEDGCLKGGLFGAVTEYMAEHGHLIPVHGLGIPDEFIHHGRQADQRSYCGLDRAGISARLASLL